MRRWVVVVVVVVVSWTLTGLGLIITVQYQQHTVQPPPVAGEEWAYGLRRRDAKERRARLHVIALSRRLAGRVCKGAFSRMEKLFIKDGRPPTAEGGAGTLVHIV